MSYRQEKLNKLAEHHQQTKDKAKLFVQYQMEKLIESGGQYKLVSFLDADNDYEFKQYLMRNNNGAL